MEKEGKRYIAIVCTDLSGKEPHRQVGVVRMATTWNIGSVMVLTLTQNARDSHSRHNISYFHQHHKLVAVCCIC